MRIALFDATEAPGPMDAWLDAVERGLAARGHAVRRVRLRERTIAQCRGCFACWVRTPGRCATRDGAEELLREALAAELVAIASPTAMGMTTVLARRAVERMIPILHPHFEEVDGEVHHAARYDRYPAMALLYGAEGCEDAEDEELLVLLHRRLAASFRSTLVHASSTSRAPEEVADALARAERIAARSA